LVVTQTCLPSDRISKTKGAMHQCRMAVVETPSVMAVPARQIWPIKGMFDDDSMATVITGSPTNDPMSDESETILIRRTTSFSGPA